jgi:SAM-dependent methyltransferase
MDNMDLFRKLEADYHNQLYSNANLYQPGSWLYRPVKDVLEASELVKSDNAIILDLGSGVGRNIFPLLKNHPNWTAIAVDILPLATDKLMAYAKQFDISDRVSAITNDIGDYSIPENSFDLVMSVSGIEHVKLKDDFIKVLQSISKSIKQNGICVLLISTDHKVVDLSNSESLEPMMGLNLNHIEVQEILNKVYADWFVHKNYLKEWSVEETRYGRQVRLESKCVVWVAQRV